MSLKKGLKINMIDTVNYIPLYIASKDILSDDIVVNPINGDIYRDYGDYQQRFNEYVRDNKLYIVIDGIMYNKAKLIYDSVNRKSLPKKRYKVVVTNGDFANPTINNIDIADLRSQETIITNNDENVTILINDIETEINIEYLISLLTKREYKVIYNEDKND